MEADTSKGIEKHWDQTVGGAYYPCTLASSMRIMSSRTTEIQYLHDLDKP